MQSKNLSVVVKLWALFCSICAISLSGNPVFSCILAAIAFGFLAIQRNWRLLRAFGLFYIGLALLLFLIRFCNLRMVIFSEFYVLMFWNLTPIFIVAWDLITTPPGELAAFLSRLRIPTPAILGLMVMFRFFPTMKAELKGVGQSMRNRGLTEPSQLLRHPAVSCEYVLVPLLLRCLQIADQLAVSAAARGAERPGVRGSYYGRRMGWQDRLWLIIWTVGAGAFLWLGDIRL